MNVNELTSSLKDLTNEEYHAHSAIGSSTLARARRSWAHAKEPLEKTKALAFGSGFHALVGEPSLFDKMYVKAPECDKRTKEGKEIFAKFQASVGNKTILTSDEWDAMNGMLESILKNQTAVSLLSSGVAEKSAFWIDKESGVLCKCRPDYLRTDNVVVDLKTAEDGSLGAFQRSLPIYGRHIQTAFYLDGLSSLFKTKFTNFVHLVVEKKPPYAVSLYSLDDESIEQGRREYKSLLMQYAMCLEVGDFPAYVEKIQTISLPQWSFNYE